MIRGFSLVELSIVLVILGLLTGGILAGQSLIRASELRSLATDFQRYHASVMTFRDKYFAMPGDFNNATKFWTSAGGTGADAACVAAQTDASTATCNGSGDGQIYAITGCNNSERFMAWKHLANAGLIEGSYTGKTAGAACTYQGAAGTANPKSKIGQGYYDLYYIDEAGSLINYFTATVFDANTISIFGGNTKPEEAWNIDTKMDDGSPVNGKLTVARPGSAAGANTCATSDADTATYNFAVTSNQCLLTFIMR